MKKRLTRQFFDRPTLEVAKDLLGKYLVRNINITQLRSQAPKLGDITVAGMIVETEAYCGPNDLACHASKGRTPRTEVMFGPAGFSYVYLIYGMYHCLNIVTEKEGYPSAVLIRGLWKVESRQWPSISYSLLSLINGPGKLCRELKIDKKLNAVDLTKSQKLWLEDRGVIIPSKQILKTKRIGVDYTGPWKDKLWRFLLKEL